MLTRLQELRGAKMTDSRLRFPDASFDGRRRKYARRHDDESHLRWMEFRYKLTREQYLKMRQDSAGLCAICGSDKFRLGVDHDHLTLAVRGLLCQRCNTMLGGLEDAEWVLKARAYLARYSKESVVL